MVRTVANSGITFPTDNTHPWTIDPRSDNISQVQFNFIRRKFTYMKGLMNATGIAHLRIQQLDSEGRVYDIEIFNGIQRVRVFPLPGDEPEEELLEMYPAFIWTGTGAGDGPYFLQIDEPEHQPFAYDHLKAYAKNANSTYYSLLAKENNSIIPHAVVEDLYVKDPVESRVGEWDWKNDGDIITWDGLEQRYYLDRGFNIKVLENIGKNIWYRGSVLKAAPENVLGAGLEFVVPFGETERVIEKIQALCVNSIGVIFWYEYNFRPTIGVPGWELLWQNGNLQDEMEVLTQGAYFNQDCSLVTFCSGTLNDSAGISSGTAHMFQANKSGIFEQKSGSILLRKIIQSVGETSGGVPSPVQGTFPGACTGVPNSQNATLPDGSSTTTTNTSTILGEEDVISGSVVIASDYNPDTGLLVEAELIQNQKFLIEGDLERSDVTGSWAESLPNFFFATPYSQFSFAMEGVALYSVHIESNSSWNHSYTHNRDISLVVNGINIPYAKLNLTSSNSGTQTEDTIQEALIAETIAGFAAGGSNLPESLYDTEFARVAAATASHGSCSSASDINGITAFSIKTLTFNEYPFQGISGKHRSISHSADISGTSQDVIRVFNMDLRHEQYSYISSTASLSGSDSYFESFDNNNAIQGFSPSPGSDITGSSTYTLKVVDGGISKTVALGGSSGKVGDIVATDFERNPSTKIGAIVDANIGFSSSQTMLVGDETSSSTSATTRGFAPFNAPLVPRTFVNKIRGDSITRFKLVDGRIAPNTAAVVRGFEDGSFNRPLEVFLPAYEYMGTTAGGGSVSVADQEIVMLNGSEATAASEVPWLINSQPALKNVEWNKLRVY